MAAAQVVSSCLYTSIRDVHPPSSGTAGVASVVKFPDLKSSRHGTAFATGSPLLIQKSSYAKRPVRSTTSISIRCEQSTKDGNSLDVWLGRLAMVGFAAALSIEIGTGKGLLENFGLITPLPTVALAVTALVGVLTAVFIFQSASKS